MGAQQVWHLSFLWTWIFVCLFLSECTGMGTPELSMDRSVFVGIKGEDLHIICWLTMPANQSRDSFSCSNPLQNKIYDSVILENSLAEKRRLPVELKTLSISGEYSCQYKTAKVNWFLRLRDEGYRQQVFMDNPGIIVVAVFTGVLLVFSVVGSVYVFRGHGKERGDSGRKRKQNREEMQQREVEEDNMDAITAPSTSFYASLETRPRSIYDVLDHSAAKKEPNQRKAKPKKKEPQEKMPQTPQEQNEGTFECVYENF
ncbi:NFAT activation molecule 1 [Pseudochaenichthys georgianus]|uniref:NFAT activation molecule 1 n=1 Tax=Pseudochaenichthys georgianus TaxID=52239 RepID=UPI00146E11DE|nr:uncharacterized protein si:ch211-243a20.4 [Pseudochaenichthys georgianus]